ncbi:MAG TPA: response regulator transcription factor [Ideonella sp.]|nr:response regulator transcription factor [Ideonella sp.]
MKCLVVDDHPLTRDGTIMALRAVAQEVEVFEAASLEAAQDMLLRIVDPDLILLDLDLEDSKGIATLETLQAWLTERDIAVRIVVLSGHCEPSLVRAVIETCATGFIVKAEARELFQHAIALTLAGGVYIPPLALRAMAPVDQGGSGSQREIVFTPRERDIAALLIKGYTYKRLAQELARQDGGAVISDQTVRAHVGNIAWKLGVTENVKSGVMAEIARRGLTF